MIFLPKYINPDVSNHNRTDNPKQRGILQNNCPVSFLSVIVMKVKKMKELCQIKED